MRGNERQSEEERRNKNTRVAEETGKEDEKELKFAVLCSALSLVELSSCSFHASDPVGTHSNFIKGERKRERERCSSSCTFREQHAQREKKRREKRKESRQFLVS